MAVRIHNSQAQPLPERVAAAVTSGAESQVAAARESLITPEMAEIVRSAARTPFNGTRTSGQMR